MKRLLLIITIMTVILAGCSGQNNNDPATKGNENVDKQEQVKLTFAVNEQPQLPIEFWEIPVKKFMESHPNVTIEIVSQPSSNISSRDHLKTLLATGKFPDVMVMTSPGDFINSGSLLAFDEADLDYIADTSVGKFEGKNYVVPYKKQVGGVFYNKDMFEEMGLQEPENWEEFIALNEAIKAKGTTPISLGVKDGWPQLITMSLLLSTDLLTDDPDWGKKRNAGEVAFADDNVVKVAEKYKKLTQSFTDESRSSISYTQMIEAFYNEQTAMYIMGSWTQADDIRLEHDFEVGFFPMPNDNDANTIPVWLNEGLAISADTKHPEVAKAFVEFFVTDPEWAAQFLQSEMLFPVTKEEVEYDKSDLRMEIEEKMKGYKQVENFYDMTGDAALLPGLQSFFDKMTVRMATDPNIDVKKELELMDKEWEKANNNLNR
ncbi:ABC transporter substrate-binding protein [Paenibacillus chungangensis]|uniref:ABC transporter substrate-binding protein n=1 Tax=Paenibacillus chungangensis TaxID=696535 RepID=A0ABW3HVP5_9BACL